MLDSINYAGFPSAEGIFRAQDLRIALANTVTGNESPEQLIRIHALDKKLALDKIKAEIGYEWQSARLEQVMALRKKRQDQKIRLFEMGAIFF